MNRRNFLAASVAIGATAPLVAQAQNSSAAAFERKLQLDPMLLAVRGATGDLAPVNATMTGRMPAALRGTLYRNGPGRNDRGPLRYRHWFDGDGLMHAWSIGAGSVSHQARFVRTTKYVAEESAGAFKYAAFGTPSPVNQPVESADSINAANTSVMLLGDELLALWEGGSAWRLDPRNLDSKGPKQWSEDLEGAPFSAHPKVDPDGTVWNFGVISTRKALVVYKITSKGALAESSVVELPFATMMHDFVVTERHLVFPMPSLAFDLDRMKAGQSFVDSHVWRPELGMPVLIIDKRDLSKRRWSQLPAGFNFHMGNAWEDSAGTISFDVALSPDDRVLRSFGDLMRGEYRDGANSSLAIVRLPIAGEPVIERTRLNTEFPRIDPRLVGKRNRQLWSVVRSPSKTGFGFDSVLGFDLDTGKTERFDYGSHVLAEEHLFIPDPAGRGERDGWLLGTSLDTKAGVSRLSVFDARALSQGPIAQASLQRALPLGFHGTFAPGA